MSNEYNINSQFTLVERMKLSIDGKSVIAAIDVMDKFGVDSFLRDVPFFPANQGLQHRVTRTTSRPSPSRRKWYKGVGATQATTQVIYEPVCLFEDRSEIDEGEVDTLTNGTELRRMQDEAHVAGMVDAFVYAMFNDNRTSGGEYIDGLGARMSSLSYPGHTTSSLPYVYDNGGSADTGSLSSLWIVEYGPRAVHGIYPGASAARGLGPFGMRITNKGREPKADSDDSSKTFYQYVTQFVFYWGVAVANDWKIARIANISSDIGGAAPIDEDVIIKALAHGKFRPEATRFYGNPYLQEQIEIKAKNQTNTLWKPKEILGREVHALRGIPFRKVDDTILSATETAVS